MSHNPAHRTEWKNEELWKAAFNLLWQAATEKQKERFMAYWYAEFEENP